jgi:two-component system cell cycle sensor histidine kinase/response regulator CckA
MLVELINNVALLVALSALYGLLARVRHAGAEWDKVLAGLLFGGLAIVAMNIPFHYSPGVIYDGRCVVLTLAGLFGGGIAAAISVALAGAYRAYLGGPGVWAGVAAILLCSMVGLAVRRVYNNRPESVGPLALYGVGIAANVVVLLCQLLLPWPGALETIGRIYLPVMLVFPAGTVLVGILLGNEERRIVAARKLRESEENLRIILNSIGDAVIATDRNGNITNMNPVAMQLTGWDEKETTGKPLESVFNIINEDTRKAVESPVKSVMKESMTVGLATHTLLISKDGTEIPIADSGAPIKNEAGEMTGVVLVFRDQTEEREYQRRIAESETKYKTAFKTSPDAINISRPDGRFVDINDGFTQLTGFARGDVIGKSSLEMDLWAIPEDREKLIRELKENGYVDNLESAFRCKDGSLKSVLLSARFTDINNEPHILSIARDITKYLHMENQLRQAQKMETIGKLAGGIAHDFNNLLMVILGYVELVLNDLDGAHRHHELLTEVKKAGCRARDITRQLLIFSRKQILQPVVLNLNDSVINLEKMLSPLIGEDIEVITAFAGDLGHVQADPGQVEQVLMNLVVNARDAMTQGGKLTIETANAALDEGYARHHVGVGPGQYVMLAVTDTGCGMDKEIMDRIFDPFFTTKEFGKGTGLGLSTVYGIVNQSGGHIACHSEPGQGTTFRIYLPRTEARPVRQAEQAPEQARPGGGEHILVAEDETAVRKLIQQMLERLGYRVTLAANGNDALALVTEKGMDPDLVITDVVMPGMSGKELIERLRNIRPGQRFLYMSGYTDNAIGHQDVLDPDTPFLQKPFTNIREFAAKIEEALRHSERTM